jgi:hypothetical protein
VKLLLAKKFFRKIKVGLLTADGRRMLTGNEVVYCLLLNVMKLRGIDKKIEIM